MYISLWPSRLHKPIVEKTTKGRKNLLTNCREPEIHKRKTEQNGAMALFASEKNALATKDQKKKLVGIGKEEGQLAAQ